MNVEYFGTKKYVVPLNIPKTHTHKYQEVINLGYAKYLDMVYNCGKFIMFNQFQQLLEKYEGKNRTEESNQTIASNIVSRLEDLGFINSEYINKNKFIYLRKPAFAIVYGNYKNNARLNLNKELKNDRFKIAIMTVELFLKRDIILHNTYMMEQLKRITKDILVRIQQTGNKFNYALTSIQEILSLDDYKEILDYLNEYSEYHYKLGVVRDLWSGVGNLYRKLILQRQTVTPNPAFYKTFVKESGEIVLHYAPNIIIFDVSHDRRYYKDKCVKLFYDFSNIGNNVLRGIQKEFLSSKRKSMGHIGDNHIGYRIVLIGEDKEILEGKKSVIDEDINSSINSPLIDYADIVPVDIGKYLYHASRKSNKFSEKHNERIDSIIASKVASLDKNKDKTLRVADKVGTKKKDDTAKPKKDLYQLVKD